MGCNFNITVALQLMIAYDLAILTIQEQTCGIERSHLLNQVQLSELVINGAFLSEYLSFNLSSLTNNLVRVTGTQLFMKMDE